MITLYDVVRYCNCKKNFGLLTAISFKNDDSRFVTLLTMREINRTFYIISIRIMNIHSNYVSEYYIEEFNVNKKIHWEGAVWESIDRPLAIVSTCFQRVSRIHDTRKVSFADWRSPTFFEMRIWQWDWSATQEISANCRGVCAGVTQFVVTNEYNMIMSRGQDRTIYSRTFSALLAEARHEHPPSCAVSFVHVCQYVTDRYTDPAARRGSLRPKLLEITNN